MGKTGPSVSGEARRGSGASVAAKGLPLSGGDLLQLCKLTSCAIAIAVAVLPPWPRWRAGNGWVGGEVHGCAF